MLGKAWLALLVLVVFISISSASILVLLSGAGAAPCAFWRLALSFIILLVINLFIGEKIVYSDKKIIGYCLVSGMFLALHFLSWMESLFYLPVSISVTIVDSFPLYNLLLDYVLFKERIRIVQVIGLFMGFTGVVLLVNPATSPTSYSLKGVILAFIGAVAATGYFSAGRLARRKISLLQYVIPAYGFAALFLLFYALIAGTALTGFTLTTYGYFVLLAILPMLGGHTLMNYLLKYMKSSTVSVISLSEPVGASILAYVFLNQALSLYQAFLIALIVFSITLVVYKEAY